ncbi:MAG: protein kinase [Gemmatimonadaceae bacterium]|nr:protein kinase [Gemmatimonadaceae bacterium]
MTSNLDEVRQALDRDYEVMKLLGRGGMATVYLAVDRKTGQQVAVKVLEPDLAGSVGHDRFLREIGIASKLQHPGILTVQDSGESNGLLYYVMRYVEGESLRDRMDREQQMAIGDALRIASEVATALHAAHEQGFIHRDIKPDNIMLSEGRALLVDFGIARAIDQAGTEKLTETGLAVGTPAYMSPEQWAGGNRVDGRADQYALACVTYEMLMGETPFGGPTAQVILARHLAADVPEMRIARPTIDPAVDEAVQRAMAKVPADRFANCAEFGEVLAEYVSTAPGSGSHRQTSGSQRQPTGSHRQTSGGHRQTSGGHRQTTGSHRQTSGSQRARTGSHRMDSEEYYDEPLPWYRRTATLIAAVAVLALGVGGAVAMKFGGGAGDDTERPRLVVLPFENQGDPSDEYFAEGVADEITSRLSNVSSMDVIARTSASQYRDKPVQRMQDELGIGYYIEGKVRWYPSTLGRAKVGISVNLIRARDGVQMWSLPMTPVELSDVFGVQQKIAVEVIKTLQIVLGAPDSSRLAARPTDDVSAYDLYLRGNAYYNKSWERADVDSAISMYKQATEQDPKFALAYAQLGKTHAWKHRLGLDETPQRLALAREAIDKAKALGPDLAETYIAEGMYLYWGEWKYEDAVTALRKAGAIQPSNAWVYLQMGNIRRRQALWPEAIAEYQKAGGLDPRSHIIWFNIGHLHLHNRQLDSAGKYLDKALTFNPTFLDALLLRKGLIASKTGDRALVRAALDSAARAVPPEKWRPLAGSWITGPMRIAFPSPRERLSIIKPGVYGLDSSLALLARAEALIELKEMAAAKAANDSALVALNALHARTPNVAWISGALSVAHAFAGHKDSAVALANQAYTLQGDALDGPMWLINKARVHVLVGNRNQALDELENVLTIPSGLSGGHLDLDAAWDPIRNDPRYKQIRAKASPPPKN